MTIKNGDLPAIPLPTCGDGLAWKVGDLGNPALVIGLTKREMFAMAAMQGLSSESCRYDSPSDMAHDAVKLADALLAELGKSK